MRVLYCVYCIACIVFRENIIHYVAETGEEWGGEERGGNPPRYEHNLVTRADEGWDRVLSSGKRGGGCHHDITAAKTRYRVLSRKRLHTLGPRFAAPTYISLSPTIKHIPHSALASSFLLQGVHTRTHRRETLGSGRTLAPKRDDYRWQPKLGCGRGLGRDAVR